MKKLMCVCRVLLIVALSMTITMSAFAAGSFSDVPASHWAYGAVNKLAQAGLIDGYGDGTFRGDKTLSRYEFAILTVKAMDRYERADEANKQLIDKLSAEFAAELNRLGARLKKVESKTNTWVGGETRFRYVTDDPSPAGSKKLHGADNFEFRQRIKFWGTINETTSWTGRISTTGGNKFGNTEYNSGSEISLDIMNVSIQKPFTFVDNMRIGRSALDFLGHGLIGKPMNVDGVLVNKKIGDAKFSGWTGNIKTGTNGDANQLTTAQVKFKLRDAQKLNFTTGYYWADIPGTSTPAGTGTLNTNIGSFARSKGWLAGIDFKIGELTLLADYASTTLVNPVGLPEKPKGWAIQLSNSQGPPVFFSAVLLVNPAKKGTDAWMVSYRSIEPGAVPSGAGGFDTMAVAYPTSPYNIFTHGTDNVKAWYLAYQNVVAKNTVLSFEYQDFKIKNRTLTGLSADDLNKTFMTKIEFFY